MGVGVRGGAWAREDGVMRGGGFSVRVVLIWRRLRESVDGTYLAYFPFALWIEVTK